ncbi:MAG: DUF4115 domain-containing protein [Deltaproteobacteria bacterium]|nr:DUF4115 domain-containing protein [Deltaproteobacteria bacterium]
MESPGEYLKRERELRGVTITKVFEATRIPLKFLQAIEADDYEGLPHPTFVKGYIKSYCKFLGIDENDTTLRYEIFLKEKAERDEPDPEVRARNVKAAANRKKEFQPIKLISNNTRNILIATAVGIVIIIAVWAFSPSAPVEQPEEVAKVEAPQAQPAPAAEPPQAVEAIPQPQAAAPVQTAPVPGKPAQVKPPEAVRPEAAVKQEPVKPTAPAVQAQTEDKKHFLTASANESVWIKIRIDNGDATEVYLRQGEKVNWKASDNFSLLIGNAGGVSLTYDGKPVNNLGISGEVVSLKLPRAQAVIQPRQHAPQAPRVQKPVQPVQPQAPKADKPQVQTQPVEPQPQAQPADGVQQ